MSERRAKQARRLLIMAGLAFRPKCLPKRAPELDLIGWENTARAEYDEAAKERR
jgi:hypothetical protein